MANSSRRRYLALIKVARNTAPAANGTAVKEPKKARANSENIGPCAQAGDEITVSRTKASNTEVRKPHSGGARKGRVTAPVRLTNSTVWSHVASANASGCRGQGG